MTRGYLYCLNPQKKGKEDVFSRGFPAYKPPYATCTYGEIQRDRFLNKNFYNKDGQGLWSLIPRSPDCDGGRNINGIAQGSDAQVLDRINGLGEALILLGGSIVGMNAEK